MVNHGNFCEPTANHCKLGWQTCIPTCEPSQTYANLHANPPQICRELTVNPGKHTREPLRTYRELYRKLCKTTANFYVRVATGKAEARAPHAGVVSSISRSHSPCQEGAVGTDLSMSDIPYY